MTEQSTSAAAEVVLNIKGPSELKLSITIALSKTVLELKQAIAEKSDVAADRQRLIYSGRVLKDEDTLSTYKVQNAHTIHMVKGAPKPSASTAATAPPQPLPSMQTGQTSTETLINGPRGHGALAGLNMADLFGGANPTDPNMMQNMMSSPQFLEQMSRMMADPALLDTIIAQSPHLQQMDPQLRATFQSEQFRNMVSNPDTLRNMMQMTAALRQAGIDPNAMAAGMGGMGGLGGLGGMGGMGGMGFPPFGGIGGTPGAGSGAAAGAAPAPSGNLFAQAATGATTAAAPGAGAGTGAAGTGANPLPGGPSPFGMLDPALIQQLLSGGGGFQFGDPSGLNFDVSMVGEPGSQGNAGANRGAPGVNPFAALGGFGAPPAPPADPRPVEERFQVQLQQLQDMGFTNASQNVRALLACGGRVDGAIEYILGGGGL